MCNPSDPKRRAKMTTNKKISTTHTNENTVQWEITLVIAFNIMFFVAKLSCTSVPTIKT